MAKDVLLSEALYIRATPDDARRLAALAEQIPIASKNTIARVALRLGMEQLEEDPARILATGAPPKRGPRRKL